jgi:hypothetical protein
VSCVTFTSGPRRADFSSPVTNRWKTYFTLTYCSPYVYQYAAFGGFHSLGSLSPLELLLELEAMIS